MAAMAKRPVDGASASAVEAAVGTATRSPVLDLVTMTTLRRDMATAAPRHPRDMALAPVRTGAMADMDRHRAHTAEVLLMAAHPHHMVHRTDRRTDRRTGHPTAPLGVATRIPRRTIQDFHRP